jgi:hypothetical protein
LAASLGEVPIGVRKLGEPEADVRAADEEEYFHHLSPVGSVLVFDTNDFESVCRRLVKSADPASYDVGGGHIGEADTIRMGKGAPAA